MDEKRIIEKLEKRSNEKSWGYRQLDKLGKEIRRAEKYALKKYGSELPEALQNALGVAGEKLTTMGKEIIADLSAKPSYEIIDNNNVSLAIYSEMLKKWGEELKSVEPIPGIAEIYDRAERKWRAQRNEMEALKSGRKPRVGPF